jgi:hypothetical protein
VRSADLGRAKGHLGHGGIGNEGVACANGQWLGFMAIGPTDHSKPAIDNSLRHPIRKEDIGLAWSLGVAVRGPPKLRSTLRMGLAICENDC